MEIFTFGMELGNALVLVAVLNSAFVFQSVLNVIETLVVLNGEITTTFDPGNVFVLSSISSFFIWTIYFWIMGVFKARKSHLAIWITGVMLMSTVWSIKRMHQVFSNPLFFQSHKNVLFKILLQIVIETVLSWYTIGVVVQVINFLWRNRGIQQSPQENERGENDAWSSTPLIPIGIGAKRLFRFYSDLPAKALKILFMLDIILTFISLLTTDNLYWIIQHSKDSLLKDKEIVENLILIEGKYMSFVRIILSIIGFCICSTKAKSSSTILRVYLASHLVLVAISITVSFLLLADREDLSTSELFHLVSFTFDTFFRFWIAHYIWNQLDHIKISNTLQVVRK